MMEGTEMLLDAALDYARRGWPVFPCYTIIDGRCSCGEAGCHSPGKHPKITDWPNRATTDPATIRQWWTRWPDANIGIPTGKPSGFFVLDGDPRHGGDETLRELEAQHGELPPTVEALTGGGGFHKLFKYPGFAVKSGAGVLGPGLDIRGDGGFIVAPPSLHISGRRYAWEASSHPDEVPIAEAPAWLLNLLRPVATNGNGRGFTVGEQIKDGERNDTLYRAARSMKKKGYGDPAILAALRAENQAKCEPPLPDAEIAKIATHATEQPDRPEFTATGEADRQEKKGAEGPSGAVLIRLSDVVPESVSWAWRNYIPIGKPAILEGDPGLGKSTLALDLAARVSTGAAMPDGSPTDPGGVVILSLEDGLADTIVPRLKAAGADLTRIVALEGVGREGKIRLPTVEDTDAIKDACEKVGAKLVIVDPLMGFLSSKQNSWRDQDMRAALGPLAKLGEAMGVAVVLIRHLNKAAGGQAIYRGGGSIGIVGASRIAFLIAKDPQDENRRIMACVKTNLGPMPPSLSYTIEGVGETSRLVWGGVTGHTANELLAMPSPEERSALDDAQELLIEILSAGPVPAKEVQRLAREAGVAGKTLQRAKKLLGVQVDKGGFQGGWVWKLAEGGQDPPKVAIQKAWPSSANLATFAGEEVCVL